MRNYAVRLDQNDETAPGPFVVGRGVRFNYQILDKTDGADEAGLDLTTGRWEVYVRAYVSSSSTATLRDEELDPSAAGGADGYIDDYFSCGTTAYPTALRWELILVDTSLADTNTKTQKREYVLLEWKASIDAAPRA